MKNIHVLPTDKDSKLYLGNLGKPVTIQSASAQFKKPLHIYITSDEEIKEGDWFIALDGSNDIYKANKVWLYIIKENSNPSQKIILTTDQDLIQDGVQSIDDEFLEWFMNNPSCEFVETERLEDGQYFDYLEDNSVIEGIYENYKIIIPKEEPNPLNVGKEFYESADKNITVYRQETLEEASRQYACYNFDSSFLDIDDHFEAGAKWQQEQDKNKYSEEEVLVKLYECLGHFAYQHNIVINGNEIDKWFEQFKKK
jgi:hypothetical protein